ncbi:MAG: TonB-dependent receptor [Pseudomonadota bacterium]
MPCTSFFSRLPRLLKPYLTQLTQQNLARSIAYTTLSTLASAPCFAQATAETVDSEIQSMDEMVVSGSRSQSKLSATPQAIGVVKNEELQRDQAKTVGAAINRIAGVYWNDLGNEQHSMGIRQPINTNAVYQYLEDGIPIRPLGVFNHNALNEMNLLATDRVEVVKGAASSLYGSNAVGGAINFLSSAPSRTPYASFGVRNDAKQGFSRYDVVASNTWGDLGLRFAHYSARRSRDNWQQYSNGNKDSFSLRGDYALSASSQLRATVLHSNLDTAMTGSLFENDYQNNPGKSLNSFTYRKDKSTRVNLAWEGETSQNGVTTLTLFSRQNDHGQLPSYTINSCVGSTCKGSINNNHVDSLGLDIKHQQEFAWLDTRLISGIYLDKSKNPYVSDNLSITRDPASGRYLSYRLANSETPTGVRNYQADIDNRALFAQWEFSPIPRLRFVLGGRSDQIRYDFTNKLAPTGSADFGAANESRSFTHFSPKVGASYALSQHSSIYSNISEGFIAPEVSQLYGKTGVPDLIPSSYLNYELGWRTAWLDGALKLDSALYRLDGKDTIVSYALSANNSENRNAGRTRSQGLELGLNYQLGAFDARLGTTLATHRFLQYQPASNLNYSGQKMPQAPSDISNLEVGYKPRTQTRLALEWLHQGESWMNNANTVKYPGHSLLNLRIQEQLDKEWAGWLHIHNLSNRRYADSASSSYSGVGTYSPNTQNQYTPGSPRSVMLGLVYTFGAR